MVSVLRNPNAVGDRAVMVPVAFNNFHVTFVVHLFVMLSRVLCSNGMHFFNVCS